VNKIISRSRSAGLGLWLVGLAGSGAVGIACGGVDSHVSPPGLATGTPSGAGDGGNPAVATTAPAGTVGGGTAGPPACPDVFAQTLQTFSIDISATDWAAIQTEFITAAKLSGDAFVNYKTVLYPIVFHYGSETVTSAFIHLKGDSSWQEAATIDGVNGKMQFVIVFDNINSKATFHGASKITLDMPRTDLTFMHDRVANTWLRSIGRAALCATNGQLFVNGSLYGLYVAEEHVGHHFVTEFFPGNDAGDLFKGGWIPETNKTAPNWTRQATFWAIKDPASLAAVVDVPNSLLEWASEALLNDSDGYYGGAHNFFIYDQGAKGYVFLANDLDSTLDYLGQFTSDPLYWWPVRHGVEVGQQYQVVVNDAALRAQYATAVRTQLGRWDVAQIQSWIDAWAPQIAAAVAADPHKPTTTTPARFEAAVALARRGIKDRADYVTRWLACKASGTGADADGDGFIWCEDCDDTAASVHPGAPEVCGNGVDDNCNGAFDEGCRP